MCVPEPRPYLLLMNCRRVPPVSSFCLWSVLEGKWKLFVYVCDIYTHQYICICVYIYMCIYIIQIYSNWGIKIFTYDNNMKSIVNDWNNLLIEYFFNLIYIVIILIFYLILDFITTKRFWKFYITADYLTFWFYFISLSTSMYLSLYI